jgi:cytidylate kinase
LEKLETKIINFAECLKFERREREGGEREEREIQRYLIYYNIPSINTTMSK